MGALTMKKYDTSRFCDCCGKRTARYRVSMCGYPVRTDRRDCESTFYVLCRPCRREWEQAWDSALAEPEPELQAA